MTDASDPLRQSFSLQAKANEKLGSPFSAHVLEAIGEQIEAGGPFRELLAPWADADLRQVIEDVVPLRILGGLQYLILDGCAEALAAQYPARTTDPDWPALRVALAATATERFAELAEFITSPPQTNEVRRSVCLFGGFLAVAGETGLPLRCLEVGSSAGLNLNWDAYRYDLGGLGAWGDPASPLTLDADWTGGPPPLTPVQVEIVERAGCDRQPIDLADERQALRLKAYVWPDQLDRLARLEAAIGVARLRPGLVEHADAAEWAAERAMPRDGAATVLFHSWIWQFLPAATQDALAQAIARAGEAATPSAPFAWLRMEPDLNQRNWPAFVRLTQWPGGHERVLAQVHPHGASVNWLETATKAGEAR